MNQIKDLKKLFCLLFALTLIVSAAGMTFAEELTPEQREALGPGYAVGDSISGQTGTAQADASGRVIDPSRPMIALTYDDGPCTGPGYRIMDAFEKAGQRCTFFVVGNRISSRAEEVKSMAARGFEIGNHSWSHAYYSKLSAEQIRADVERCNEAIRQVTGVTPALIRTPGGIKGGIIMENMTMPMILWNIDTLDWKTRNADSTVNAVLSKVKDGDVILMHELYGATATATERLVPELVARGYQLVTVSELAKYKGVNLAAGHYYYSF